MGTNNSKMIFKAAGDKVNTTINNEFLGPSRIEITLNVKKSTKEYTDF